MLTATSGVGVMKSVHRGEADVTAGPLELTGTERIDDITIVLTTDTGSLTGMVTDGLGRPAPGALVIVFPEDSKRWSVPFISLGRAMSTLVSPSRTTPGVRVLPRQPGQFTVPRILPGRYLVAAVQTENPNSFAVPDAEGLASLRPSATAITIRGGEMLALDLKLK
jgi:hypothetical protein